MIVQAPMASAAQEGQIVDVGGTLGWFRPWDDVVSFAPGRLGGAEYATTVSGHQGAPLSIRGGPLAPPMPERFTLAGEQKSE